MFWFFLALPLFPREKALKKEKRVVKETTFFIDNGDVETNMPFTKMSVPSRAERKDCYFENNSLSSKTYYLESCTNTGRLITFQFFAMPPGITNVGLASLSAAPSRIALANPALRNVPVDTPDVGEKPRASLRLLSSSCIKIGRAHV